ncbi:LysR family transcriptional regulator [Nocardia gamkensis]|uniref:LysR family transcriptional regulator n=1 Tax=Nocardia gamkensis TaxID=352869 RepID=UPI0033F16D26
MEAQLSLKRLEVFRLVVEEGTVTRAAEVLMVAQPAVSGQLRALESWLGAKLFVRRGNSMVLTEAGVRADAWAKEVLASAAQVKRDVVELSSGQGGAASIASSMAVGSYLLPPILSRFQRGRPGADITLSSAQPNDALRAVETGEADFAVVSWDQRHLPETISVEVVRTEPIILCAGPGIAVPPGELTMDQALRLPFVGAPREVIYQRNLMEQLTRHSNVEPRFIIRFGHAEPMKQAAADNGWALFAPRYVVGADITAGRLRELIVPGLELSERIALLWRRDKYFSPLQNAAVEEIRRVLRSDATE